ncbi:MAG: CheR family methyltransferase [Candidatus Methanospirareceae archaeon]
MYELDDEIALDALKRKIYEKTGLDCSKYSNNYLLRRIRVIMNIKGINFPYDYKKYIELLEKNPLEYTSLLDNITINVTEFFRDPETFDTFKNEILPEILSEKRRRKSKILRIWSAGCASGEEPYTISIILFETLGSAIKDFLISIYATDINKNALKKAKEGIYDASSLKNVPKPLIHKYFSFKEGKYKIKEEVKKLVRFQQHDLFSGIKYSHFDVIFCRNVLMFFSTEYQRKLLLDFYHTLNDGGYLILGRAETIIGEIRDKFMCVNAREKIYKKI